MTILFTKMSETSSESATITCSGTQTSISSNVERTDVRTLAYRLFKFKNLLVRKNRQHLLLAKSKMELTLFLVYANPSEHDEIEEQKFELLYNQAVLFDVTEYGIALKKATNMDDRSIIKYTDRYMQRWQQTRYIIKNKTSPDVPKQVTIGRDVAVREKTLNLKRRDRKYKY